MGAVELKTLKENLLELGAIGRTPEGGVTRLTGTEEDKKAREWIVRTMEEVGLETRVDKIGNIFGRKDGTTDTKVVMTGSHLDTVPNGGAFDGSLGVLMSLEAVNVMEEEGFQNSRPIEVAVFTEEEGSRFQFHLGSRVFIGDIAIEKAWGVTDNKGVTVHEALRDIGYRGDFQSTIEDVAYYLEPHIEQGPILYSERIPVGIVRNVVGLTQFNITIQGEENHAGTTPMHLRKDALVAASDITLFVNDRARQLAKKLNASLVATVGRMTVWPNGINVIPGEITIGIDVRSAARQNMQKLKDDIVRYSIKVGNNGGMKVRTNELATVKPVVFSNEMVESIERACRELNVDYKMMNSGAGHDAQEIAQRTKAGMIFVPSVNGISHSARERTDWEDIQVGTSVLTRVLKNLTK